jgi:3'-5' exonuclease
VTDTLVLDIETIPDPDLPPPRPSDDGKDRIPSPPYHRIVSIGALLMDQRCMFRRIGLIGEDKDEAGMLSAFASYLESSRPWIISFNGRGFDLPVIGARCFRHGIPLKYYYNARDVRYRHTPDGHFDLMDFLADYGASKCTGLDVMAKLCGMPGKLGVNGNDVATLVAAGNHAAVKDYCLCDVVQTAAVFLRVQLLRGELSRDEYLNAATVLRAWINWDLRLEPVAKAMNSERFLLNG